MEIVRRIVRSVLRSDSWLYRTGATALDCLSTTRTDGYKTWRILRELGERDKSEEPPRSVTLRNLIHPIAIRPGTQDAGTIVNNVIREEYGHFRLAKDPAWIIDAGAYIGDTAAYFLSRFSTARVIALEPNPPSHEMARRNLAPYGERAILLRKGLSSSDGVFEFSGGDTGAAITDSGFRIDCTTVSTLMDQYSIPCCDIVKMDIEGAEEAVFRSKPEAWLRRVRLLIIEIHGRDVELLVSGVLKRNGFSMKQYRSIWYCRSNRG